MSDGIHKIYCYVDETGQDTAGEMFLVSVVLTEGQSDELRKQLRIIEEESGKGKKKWTKTTKQQRLAYVQATGSVISSGSIFFSHYRDSRAYVDLAILTTAKAILAKTTPDYEARVYVDGLRRSDRVRFTAGLRKLQVRLRLARGLNEDADEFIRLADAIAGFVRDAIEGDKALSHVFESLKKKKLIVEI